VNSGDREREWTVCGPAEESACVVGAIGVSSPSTGSDKEPFSDSDVQNLLEIANTIQVNLLQVISWRES
jgi:hypothetical protein